MKHGITFLCAVTCSLAGAQTVPSFVISSSGNSQSNAQIKASWTLGEPITSLMTNSGTQLSNGYHAQMNLEALSITSRDIKASILLYPNPAEGYLMIRHESGQNLFVTIYNQSGQDVLSQSVNSIKTKINLANLQTGVYIVKFNTTDQSNINTYKLIKK